MRTPFYEIQFEIENSCLLDCIHCSSLETRKSGRRTYTDEDLLSFLSLFSDNVHIYFTGGEPLLYYNLLPLCEEIKTRCSPISIGLYTTGNCKGFVPVSENFAIDMKNNGVVDCFFSLYRHDSSIHDRWTGKPGSYGNTINSVKNVTSAGIITKAHVVINKDNYQVLNKMIDFCKEVGIKEIRFLKLVRAGSAAAHWDEIGLPEKVQNSAIKDMINTDVKNDIRISVSGYPTFHPCRSFEGAKGCQAGINLLYVDALGDVYPCACTKNRPEIYKICNIKEQEKMRVYIESQKNVGHHEHCLNVNNRA